MFKCVCFHVFLCLCLYLTTSHFHICNREGYLLIFFQECLGILAARCASCNCMTYFYCAPLQVYTPFRSAQNHCPPDNVRPAGGYIVELSWHHYFIVQKSRGFLNPCFAILSSICRISRNYESHRIFLPVLQRLFCKALHLHCV